MCWKGRARSSTVHCWANTVFRSRVPSSAALGPIGVYCLSSTDQGCPRSCTGSCAIVREKTLSRAARQWCVQYATVIQSSVTYWKRSQTVQHGVLYCSPLICKALRCSLHGCTVWQSSVHGQLPSTIRYRPVHLCPALHCIRLFVTLLSCSETYGRVPSQDTAACF